MPKKIYPHRLLPKKSFPIYNLRERYGNFDLIRMATSVDKIRTPDDINRCFKASMQSKEFIDGVSVFLVSGYRKLDRLYAPNFKLNPSWKDYWNGEKSTPRPVGGVSRLKKKTFFGFHIKDLYSIEFEYTPTIREDGPDMQPLKLTVRVEHKPSNINYWHCNIYICEKGSLQDVREILDSKVIKRIAKRAVPQLQAKVKLPKNIKQRKIR